MASLKDMRVRIAATKATQKITKAMQMVAASKLRRAQAAAEAARPYAERMSKVLGSIAAAVAGSDSAPRLLAGTGTDKVHLLVVCTAERGLCGPFNSSIVRLAREKANALITDGKEVKILCIGRKGYEQLRRLYGKLIIETIELRGVRTIGYEQADMIAGKIVALFDQGAFDVATLFFSRFKSVVAQVPTAQQIIPPVFEKDTETGPLRPTNMSRKRKKSLPSCCRATCRSRYSARSSKMPHPSKARAWARWTTPPVTPAR